MSSGDLGGVSCPTFDQLAPPPNRSLSELNDFFANAKDILQDAEDWKAQFNVLNEIQRMAKYTGEVLCSREGVLVSLVEPLSQMCASLRSSLVRAACQTVTVLALTIPESLSRTLLHASSPPTQANRSRTSRPPKLEALVKSLVLKATSPAEKKFIHSAAEEAGDALAVIPELADGIALILLHIATNSKNSKVIGRCGVMLNRILESRASPERLTRALPSQSPQTIQNFLNSAVSLLSLCLHDRLAESRALAKTTVELLRRFTAALDGGRTHFFEHMLTSTFAQVGNSISSPSLRLAFSKATQGEPPKRQVVSKLATRSLTLQSQRSPGDQIAAAGSSRTAEALRGRSGSQVESAVPHLQKHFLSTRSLGGHSTQPQLFSDRSAASAKLSFNSPGDGSKPRSSKSSCGDLTALNSPAAPNSRPSTCVEERGVSIARIRETNLFGGVGLPPRLPSSLSSRKNLTTDSSHDVEDPPKLKPVIVAPPEFQKRGRDPSSCFQQRRRSISLCRPKTFTTITRNKTACVDAPSDGELHATASTASSSCLSSHIPLPPRDLHRRASSLCQHHSRETTMNKPVQPDREDWLDPPDWLGDR